MKKHFILLALMLFALEMKSGTQFTYNSVTYEVISKEDKTCKVVGHSSFTATGQSISLSIPDEVNGYTPIEIAAKAFYETNDYIRVSFLNITDSIETIGSNFWSISRAHTPTFDVPTKLRVVQKDAFNGGGGGFSKVNIKDYDAWCRIDFENFDSNPASNSRDGIYLNGEKVTNIEIPNTITEVKQFAFVGFTPNSVTFPSSITLIHDKAFLDKYRDSPTIQSVTSLNLIPPTMEGQIFNSTTLKNSPLYVPKTAIEAYKEAPYWKEFNNIVGIDIEAKGILLNKNVLSLYMGQTEILEATVTPENTTDPVVWSCSPENVATVEDGKVTALSSGMAIVTARCGFFTSSCTVMVSGETEENPSQPGVNSSDLTGVIYMIPDEDRSFNDLLNEGTAASWESSNEDIAEVNKKGRVDAYEFGRCYITAKDSEGEPIAVFELFVCPTVKIHYGTDKTYEHHVIYNSTPSLYIAAPEGYEIVSISHDGEDVTEAVNANDGYYTPDFPITDNSVISVNLVSTKDPADINGDGVVNVIDLNMVIERMNNY